MTKAGWIKRTQAALLLLASFLWEFAKSNWAIAKVSLSSEPPTPCIVDLPLDIRSPGGIALLANLITLTPGTLSLDLSDDMRSLRVHAVIGADPDGVVTDIKRAFERYIILVFDGVEAMPTGGTRG